MIGGYQPQAVLLCRITPKHSGRSYLATSIRSYLATNFPRYWATKFPTFRTPSRTHRFWNHLIHLFSIFVQQDTELRIHMVDWECIWIENTYGGLGLGGDGWHNLRLWNWLQPKILFTGSLHYFVSIKLSCYFSCDCILSLLSAPAVDESLLLQWKVAVLHSCSVWLLSVCCQEEFTMPGDLLPHMAGPHMHNYSDQQASWIAPLCSHMISKLPGSIHYAVTLTWNVRMRLCDISDLHRRRAAENQTTH